MLSTPSETAARVTEIIAQSKSLPLEAVTPASTLDSLQIDSLDKINITFDIEEFFKITISDKSIDSLRTVDDVITGVQTLLAAKSSASQPDAPAS